MGGKPVGNAILAYLKNEVPYWKHFAHASKPNHQLMGFAESFEPDLIVVAYYDYILPKEIIDIPKYGCINVHLADAERYRGCYPTTRAILNGDKEYGVTIHYIDEGIDTGDILYKTNFKIPEHTTGKELYDMATKEGIEAFKEFWPKFKAGELKGRKQGDEDYFGQHFAFLQNPFPRKFDKLPREIELDEFKEASTEIQQILAFDFPPYEGAYIMIGDKKYKVVPA